MESLPSTPPRPAKRTYSAPALEAWFERLAEDWEHHFAAGDLERARAFYRDGAVRAFELGEQDAIVHAKQGRQDVYAMLEWAKGAPQVRCSVDDPHFGRALAAAGLYEIEELIADEITPVRFDDLPPKAAPKTAPAPPRPAAHAAVRPLRLRLAPQLGLLALEAHWLEADQRRTPALGNGHLALSTAERERLIRLTAMTRRAGFELAPDAASYRLASATAIQKFLRDELPRWKRLFHVEADPRLDKAAQGVQAALAEISVLQNGRGLKLSWDLRVGGTTVPAERAREILRQGPAPFLHPDFGVVQLAGGQAEILADFQSLLRADGAEAELPAYLVFSLFGQDKVRVHLSPALKAWRDALLSPPAGGAELRLPDLLRPYQRKGVEWMRRLAERGCHGLLADEMGLGKTLQAAAFLDQLGLTRPHLIVCPASVVPVWRAELAAHFPKLPILTLHGGHDWTHQPGPVIWLASYTQLRRHRELLEAVEFGAAILDEAQFIKNPEAKVTQTCFAIRARHRFALTGTPVENRHLDLWTIFRFLMPGLLGTRARFEAAIAAEGPAAVTRLRQQIAPFVLRRTKDTVGTELPPKVEMPLLVPLTDLQAREYRRLAEEGLRNLGEDLSKAVRDRSLSFFTLLTRLRQCSCDPGLLPWMSAPPESSGKIAALLARLPELLDGGHKVVVFSQFVSLLRRVKEALKHKLPGTVTFELTGQTIERAKPVQDFQKRVGPAVFLVSLKAGGTGITLHAADYVFLLDPWWNPAVEEQAVDRVHRLGQQRPVFIYRLVSVGTVEERIERLKAAKRELFRATVGDLADVSEFRHYFESLSSLIALAPSAETTEEA